MTDEEAGIASDDQVTSAHAPILANLSLALARTLYQEYGGGSTSSEEEAPEEAAARAELEEALLCEAVVSAVADGDPSYGAPPNPGPTGRHPRRAARRHRAVGNVRYRGVRLRRGSIEPFFERVVFCVRPAVPHPRDPGPGAV